MKAPALDYRREAPTPSPDGRAEVKDRASINGASDAETRYDSTFYAEVARHLHTSGYCLCVHCLGRYCFGTKASADALVSAVTILLNVSPLKLAHRDDTGQRRLLERTNLDV